MSETLHLGEPADETDWRAMVEKGLKGAPWGRLVGKTADGLEIAPLYREPDYATAADVSGFPGAAPFTRGRAGWLIRQAYAHPDPARVNRDILADLAGGVAAIELVIDPTGARGVAITSAADLDAALANVILEAAPISLDGGGVAAARLLEAKLKGVAAPGTAFNLDLVWNADAEAIAFAKRIRSELPNATALRADARPVHEAGGSEAQEIGAGLAAGLEALRALTSAGVSIEDAAASLAFAMSVGPDVLVEAAKLRALRLCWARVMEASGAAPEAREARIHAFTSQRMLTRYDSYTNILRLSTAAFGAAVGGAHAISVAPFTDALGHASPFARRVARNTQNVLMEECRLDHVADPAGGAWFVENVTRELADKGWAVMQAIEAKGGMVAALKAGALQAVVDEARAAREKLIATRKETITGVTDFPSLDAAFPAFEPRAEAAPRGALAPIRWAAPFEALRDSAAASKARPSVFFANLASLAEFGPRAQWSRNLVAVGGASALGAEDAYASIDALIDAFTKSGARVALIASTDAVYAEQAENCAQRLKAAGADWVLLAGKPGESEDQLRAAGVDQFVYAGVNVLKELETLHAALGIG
ncbi:MAG TPA: methylmalonyl-CoA mutase family protein [Terricaulis sp.]|nr:methylmalonyl-CoA mutase family protein [Terricaulis sp.]